MNPLSIHFTNAELDYRREKVADGMTAAAEWTRAAHSLGDRILQLAYHESRESRRIRRATAH